jgi:hypothetical protein
MASTRRAKSLIEVCILHLAEAWMQQSEFSLRCLHAVARLYAHSKNYDMDMTLDYNLELFPLRDEDVFSLALASSLAREGRVGGGEDDDEKDKDVWRPDGKGRRGLEEDYEYVMYGKVRVNRCCHNRCNADGVRLPSPLTASHACRRVSAPDVAPL